MYDWLVGRSCRESDESGDAILMPHICIYDYNPGFFNNKDYGLSTYRIEAAQFGRLAHIIIALLRDIILTHN